MPLEVDAGGLVPEALERAARAGEARMLYVVPTLQSPTTATLNLERRLAIVDIARRYGLTIIEDDIFRLLDPRLQPPTLYTLAPERTYHITSVSKTLAPGLRVGFLVGPAGKTDGLIRHQTITNGRVGRACRRGGPPLDRGRYRRQGAGRHHRRECGAARHRPRRAARAGTSCAIRERPSSG